MPQMLFPAPATTEAAVTRNTGRAAAGDAGSRDSGKTEESRFGQMTRTERERMEQPQTPPQTADEPTSTVSRTEEPGQDTDVSVDQEAAVFPGDAESGYVPITFAALQPVVAGMEGSGVPPGQSGSLPGLLTDQMSPGSMRQYLDAALQQMTEDKVDSSSVRLSDLTDPVSRQVMTTGNRQAAETVPLLRGYTTSVELPVGHAQWGDQVVGKLTWLTARNLSEAEIHLTPPDMGPLEVKVRVQHDQASITVHAANPVVRDQLELHSHRLRDMLEQQGLSLQQFDVSGQSGNQAGGEHAEEGSGRGPAQVSASVHEEADIPLASGSLDLGWNGEVDVFA